MPTFWSIPRRPGLLARLVTLFFAPAAQAPAPAVKGSSQIAPALALHPGLSSTAHMQSYAPWGHRAWPQATGCHSALVLPAGALPPLVRQHLKEAGLELAQAQTFAQAERRLQDCRFSALFVDVDTLAGRPNRLAVLRRSRPDLTIVLLTSNRGAVAHHLADAILQRPFSLQQVDVILENIPADS